MRLGATAGVVFLASLALALGVMSQDQQQRGQVPTSSDEDDLADTISDAINRWDVYKDVSVTVHECVIVLIIQYDRRCIKGYDDGITTEMASTIDLRELDPLGPMVLPRRSNTTARLFNWWYAPSVANTIRDIASVVYTQENMSVNNEIDQLRIISQQSIDLLDQRGIVSRQQERVCTTDTIVEPLRSGLMIEVKEDEASKLAAALTKYWNAHCSP